MSDIRYLEVPKWGLSMEEGTVTEWLIAPGDSFSEGDSVCEIETSKITNVVEAPFSGTLRRIIAEPGVTLAVGARIGICADPLVGEDAIDAAAEMAGASEPGDDALPASQDGGSEATTAPATAGTRATTGAAASQGFAVPETLRGATAAGVIATPAAVELATALGVDLGQVTATGRGGRVSVSDLIDAIEAGGGTIGDDANLQQVEEFRSTPLARRIASQLNVDLASVEPTGSRGRIQRADVEAAAGAQAPKMALGDVPAFADVPMNGMRRAIARALTDAARDIPHFRLQADIRIDALLALRKELLAATDRKLSVTDLLIKAASQAMIKVPDCNVQVHGDVIRRFDTVDICIAVALEGGLVTPKITGVEAKSVMAVAAASAERIAAAREGRLMPDDLTGGTFTISNLGMFGVDRFDAIINPPQGSILSVGAGRTEGHGFMNGDKPATIMTVGLSCDHRAIDGALAAHWMQVFKTCVENPMTILV